jgi:DNA-binding IclR family transcriptional regulator
VPSNDATRSVLNALQLIEAIAARQPVGVSELSRILDMPKSSVQRGLQTLNTAGWIRPTGGDGLRTRWQVSHKALTVGVAGLAATNLSDAALDEIRALRDALGETVHLGVPEGHELVIIGKMDGTQPLRTFLTLGTRAPLHASATGRAVLARFDDSTVEKILAHGVARYTEETLVDTEAIWRELRQTRSRGYAINHGEWREGIAAVGAAVIDRNGSPIAAISVSMPTSRFVDMDEQATGNMVIAAAQRISHMAWLAPTTTAIQIGPPLTQD